jgi:glycosyltransferase involved in cell wall biosynthesis
VDAAGPAGGHRGDVLFVTSSYPRWAGDATAPFVHHLARDMQALGWEVRVLAPHAPGASRQEVLDGIPVRRFRYAWPEKFESLCYEGGALPKLRTNPARILLVPFFVVGQFIAVLTSLVRHRQSLVHSHWLVPQGFTAGIAATLLGCPHVATAHGSDVFALRGTGMRLAKRVVLRLADAVTANSEATRRAIVEIGAPAVSDKLVCIPMGAGFDGEPRAAEVVERRALLRRGQGPLLVFVGRLIPEKGASDLLEAVAQLATSHPDVTAVVVGDGPERSALERQAAMHGIPSRIRFTGWLAPAAVQAHLAAADIFIGPSRPGPEGGQEAQGLAFAEAMLAARPIVATAIGGIPEAIRDGETGLLVPPGDPGSIADAVRRLAADPAWASRLGAAARRLAEKEFTRPVSAARFAALYRRLAPACGRSKT